MSKSVLQQRERAESFPTFDGWKEEVDLHSKDHPKNIFSFIKPYLIDREYVESEKYNILTIDDLRKVGVFDKIRILGPKPSEDDLRGAFEGVDFPFCVPAEAFDKEVYLYVDADSNIAPVCGLLSKFMSFEEQIADLKKEGGFDKNDFKRPWSTEVRIPPSSNPSSPKFERKGKDSEIFEIIKRSKQDASFEGSPSPRPSNTKQLKQLQEKFSNLLGDS